MLVISLCFVGTVLRAQEAKAQDKIKEIAGEGFVHHDFRLIKDLLEVREGQEVSIERIERDLHRLAEKGFFVPEKVKYRIEKLADQPGWVRLVFSVEEYKIIDSVELVGVKTQDAAVLQKTLRLRKGDPLNPLYLYQDQLVLQESYLSKGYALVAVSGEKAEGVPGVQLRWNIREGPLVTVDAIEFSGNQSLATGSLKAVMQTKENGFFSSSPFVAKTLERDLERLKLYYYQEGWVDIVKKAPSMVFIEDLKFSEDKSRVTIKIHVDEPPRYTLRKVRFEGVKLLKPEEIQGLLLVSKEGEYYSDKNAQQDAQKIREAYGEKAYSGTEVTVETLFAEKGYLVDLIFRVKESEKLYVGKIFISGNERTRDDVIRREMRVYPGEEFNAKELKRSIDRLKGAGTSRRWFESVTSRTEEGGEPTSQDIYVDVKEARTGDVNFGVGFSSAFGVLGMIRVTQDNFDAAKVPDSLSDLLEGKAFVGGGQFLGLTASPGQFQSMYRADFTEPYIMTTDYGVRLSVFKIFSDFEAFGGAPYSEDQRGGNVTFFRRFYNGDLQVSLGGDVQLVTISAIASGVSADIQALQGPNRIIKLIPGIRYDKLDNPMDPTEGYIINFTHELSGSYLASDFNFAKARLETAFYKTIYKTDEEHKHVLGTSFGVGLAAPMAGDSSLPIFERYFAGGRGTVRGFRFLGVGPHDPVTGDPIGGNVLYHGSVEYVFPLYENVVRGAFFYDMANLSGGFSDLNVAQTRMSAGFGLRVFVPYLGVPVSLDFGIPLRSQDGDRVQFVTFDITPKSFGF